YRAGRQEFGSRPLRAYVDGNPRHGHRGRDHRHPSVAGEAHGFCAELVRDRCVGRIVGLRPSRRLGAAGVLDRPLVRVVVHGGNRRHRLDPRFLPWRLLHHDPADLPEPAAGPPRDPAINGNDLAYRVHGLWRADRVFLDRRAAWARPAMGDRERETAAVALPALTGPVLGSETIYYGRESMAKLLKTCLFAVLGMMLAMTAPAVAQNE